MYPKRPLLAATIESNADMEKLTYPLYASPKLDGIRCLIHPTLGPVTRSLKPIPNQHTRELLRYLHTKGFCFDGELVTGQYVAEGALMQTDDFNTIQSKIMSHGGVPNVVFQVFDVMMHHSLPIETYLNEPFESRLRYLAMLLDRYRSGREVFEHPSLPHVVMVEQTLICSAEELRAYELLAVQHGYEGIITRHAGGIYKQGRSTLKQQILLKLKRWADAEGVVIGFEELMVNENSPEVNSMGLQERKKRLGGMIHGETLGALVLRTEWGVLKIGSGLDDAMRKRIWELRSEFGGKLVTFKYQKHGMKGLPRFPIFKGFRSEADIGAGPHSETKETS